MCIFKENSEDTRRICYLLQQAILVAVAVDVVAIAITVIVVVVLILANTATHLPHY